MKLFDTESHYPLIYIPELIGRRLYTVNFPLKKQPTPPYFKEKDGWGSIFKTNSFIKKKAQYLLDCKKHERELKEYFEQSKVLINNGIKGFNDYQRLKEINQLLSRTSPHKENADYKQGFYHSFLKHHLERKYKGFIYENISVESDRLRELNEYYETFDEQMLEAKLKDDIFYDRKYNLYVSDFAFIKNNIKIIIELDEPYSLSNKTPIHYDDSKRNKFFLDNGYFIIRFCEEQVLFEEDLCIKTIESLTQTIETGKIEYLQNFYENIPKIKRWSKEDAEIMIKQRHREKYMQKRLNIAVEAAKLARP